MERRRRRPRRKGLGDRPGFRPVDGGDKSGFVDRHAENPRKHEDALSALLSRRRQGPASRVRRGASARQAGQGGARMEGPVAFQRRKDAVLFRQRPENGLVRPVGWQERQYFRLCDGDRGADLSRGGGAPCGRGGPAPAAQFPRGGGAGRAARRPARSAGHGGGFFRSDAQWRLRARGAGLSRPARDRDRRAKAVPPRLRPAREIRAARPSRRQGRRQRDDDRGRAPDPWRGDRRPL